MGWRTRVLWRGVSARVPMGDTLRRIKRQAFGYAPSVSNLKGTLDAFEWMKQALQREQRSLKDAVALEIGSGWFPTIPILMSLEGARKVFMTDLTPHMDDVTFKATLDFLRSEPSWAGRTKAVNKLADLPITYLAPMKPDDVPNGSLDYVVSRTVLEHIPPDDLVGLFSTLLPKMKPDGLMLHVVDNSDHMEHRDKSLSRLNFLIWEDKQHQQVNRWMRGGENRLRHHEYAALFARAGFKIIYEHGQVHGPTERAVAGLKPHLQPHFAAMSAPQLATLTSYFVLAPAASATVQG